MRVVTVIGARPQFIKAAPVTYCLRQVADEFLVHTGQHYDESMSQVFFDELGLPRPDVDLGVGSGPHGAQTAGMLAGIEQILLERHPDLVLVYGDTNSTLAGALAAAKLQIPLAHVEAGLRSGRRSMPEEINRVLTDHVADLLFCPTATAVEHLRREGIEEGVFLVGDVMVDALESMRGRLDSEAAARHGVIGDYYLATIHRAETVDDPERLTAAMAALSAVPGRAILPVHPRTAAAVERYGASWPDNVVAIDPVGYREMLSLVAGARATLTDSGGLQKESVLLGTRCLTLREETEWPETLSGGWNTVVGLDRDNVTEVLKSPDPSEPFDSFPPGASQRIVDELVGWSGGAFSS